MTNKLVVCRHTPGESKKPSFFNDQEYEFAKTILLNSQAQFEKLVVIAEQQMSSNHYEEAANSVMQAAAFAIDHHPGLYFSHRLEKILLQCAAVLKDQFNLPISNLPISNLLEKSQHKKRNVLHVLTEGYEIGGHTRLVARWCERDTTSVHSVLALESLFRQTTPAWVSETAKKTGGWYCSLYDFQFGLCGRAKILRDIAYSWADVVVLHIHPFDPIATMAFGIEGGPPVIFLNHADHTFWLGVSVADIVANIRPYAQLLTNTRRGTERSMILPIPLDSTGNSYTKMQARKMLQINEGKTVLLSVGSSYKFVSCEQYDFLKVLEAIACDNKNILILIVGQEDSGKWHELKVKTANCVQPVGLQGDINLFYAAADIFLNPFCIGSSTALLEAGMNEIPIYSMQTPDDKLMVDIDVLPKDRTVSYTMESYKENIKNLIDKPNLRSSLGKEISYLIKDTHIDKWNQILDGIYTKAAATHHLVYQNYEKVSEWGDIDLVWTYFKNKPS